jgi:hypothetical protein
MPRFAYFFFQLEILNDMVKRMVDILSWAVIALWLLSPWEFCFEATLGGGRGSGSPFALIVMLSDTLPAFAGLMWLLFRNRRKLNQMRERGTLYKIHLFSAGALIFGTLAPIILLKIVAS